MIYSILTYAIGERPEYDNFSLPALQFVYMALAIEACCELLLKNSKVMLYFPLSLQKSPFNQLYNKMEHFNFKSGCVVRVAKLIKEEWLIVLQLRILALYFFNTGV